VIYLFKRIGLRAAAFGLLLMALGGSPSVILAGESPVEKPTVTFSTTLGNVTIELFPDKAPVTVENFLAYVDSGFYNGTIFHRVVSGFVLQGGGFTEEMSQKPTRSPIKNEADNGLKNKRGTLSMARTRDIKSATSQFFINLKDNRFLDNGARDFGYAVFGKVMEGMEVVDKISAVRTGNRGPYRNVPLEPVVIRSARRK
jgi:peptidyl-prolyl cis-trans isomerase A (cyclophilin A)